MEQLFDIYGIDDENTPLVINENDSETRKALKRAMNEQIFKKRQQDFLSGKAALKNLAENLRKAGSLSNTSSLVFQNSAQPEKFFNESENFSSNGNYNFENLRTIFPEVQFDFSSSFGKFPIQKENSFILQERNYNEEEDFSQPVGVTPLPIGKTDEEILQEMKPVLKNLELSAHAKRYEKNSKSIFDRKDDYVYIDTMCKPTIGKGHNLKTVKNVLQSPIVVRGTSTPVDPIMLNQLQYLLEQQISNCKKVRAAYSKEEDRKAHLPTAESQEKIFGRFGVPPSYIDKKFEEDIKEAHRQLKQHMKNKNKVNKYISYETTPDNIKKLYIDLIYNSGKSPFSYEGVEEKHMNMDWEGILDIINSSKISKDRIDYRKRLVSDLYE